MDYENKYNKAVEKARAINSGKYVDIPAEDTVLEYIFPELKSEDERIRNGIIALLKFSLEDGSAIAPGFNETKEQALAWLEKQYNTSKKVTYTHEVEVGNGNIKALVTEEISTDMVEPKFKVGDYVVGKYISGYISEVRDDCYLLGYHGFSIDKQDNYHLWTIEDAKNGDVLQLGDVTAIFQECIGNGNCKCYCSICNGEFEIPIENGDNIYGCHEAKPANMEQRSFLFYIIKEAGYEWDAEKKELKMIVTPIFNIGSTIIKKHNSDIHDFGSFTITDITGGKYWYNDRIICNITEQNEWELYESVKQNPTWSEEDERICRNIINDIVNEKSMCKYEISRGICDEQINWLKSLKERMKGE